MFLSGGYGCGKSILIHQQIQRYQEKDDSILVYLGMDEYSLHQVLVDEHCAKVSEQLNHQIVCKSVADVSLENGSSNRLLSLSECLESIQKDYPDKKIDVVVDELDGEDLNEEEIKKLKEKLKSPPFASTLFYLSLQSCQKKRQLEHNKKREETTTSLDQLEIEVFRLEKTMRFTTNIGITVSNSQKKVEAKPNIYFCNLPTRTEIKTDLKQKHQSELNETPQRETCSVSPVFAIGEEDRKIDYLSGTSAFLNPGEKPKLSSSMKIPTMKMDSYLKNFVGNKNSSTKVTSHFEYFKAMGSGVNIQGKKPNFMRILDKTSVSSLAFFIRKLYEREDKIMIICNTRDMITLAKAALETVKLSYVEYTNSVRNLPAPPTLEKKSILYEWRNNAQVLLTDCRGCRGMECQEVKLFELNAWNFIIFITFKFKINTLNL